METLLLARAKYLLDSVSNNVKYPTLDGSPALPAEAAALIECLRKLGLVEDADAMRKDFSVYFAHEVRLLNTRFDPPLVEFRLKANELFGPFLKYSPVGDSKVVRLRLIDHFDGLRITFKKFTMLASPLTPPTPGTGAEEGKAGTTTQANQPPKAPARRPPKIAFRAWYVRDVLGVATQQQIADEMTRQGSPVTQGQVSKWLAAVEEYRKAGGILPTLDELNKADTDTVDPAIIEMGARLDGRTPRQRPRPDDEADSWPE